MSDTSPGRYLRDLRFDLIGFEYTALESFLRLTSLSTLVYRVL
jgi:hypothetical protein